jgi:hypothetical protein
MKYQIIDNSYEFDVLKEYFLYLTIMISKLPVTILS